MSGDKSGVFEAIHRPPQPKEHRLFGLITQMSYLGMGAHCIFIPLFLWLDVPVLAAFNVLSVGAWAVAWLWNRRGHHDSAIMLMGIEAVMHAVLAVLLLGWDSGFAYYLIAVVPATTFVDRIRTSTVLLIAMVLCLVFVALYFFTGRTGADEGGVLALINYGNIAVVFAAIGIMTYYFRAGSDASEHRMQELAGTDQLTELPNRRRLLEVLEIEKQRCERNGLPLVLMLSDIDFFKQVNDRHGHDAGDFVLRSIADLLRDALRQQDLVGRWGGEEFLGILPDTPLDQAVQVAERMRRKVENARLEFAGERIPVTMTFGLACFAPGTPVDVAIKQADLALYEGKESGRNRVVVVPAAAA